MWKMLALQNILFFSTKVSDFTFLSLHHTCVHAKSVQSCPPLCTRHGLCSPPGSSVHGIFQARILEWIAISFFRDIPDPGIELTSLMSPALASGFVITSTTKEALSGKPSGGSLGSDIIGHN